MKGVKIAALLWAALSAGSALAGANEFLRAYQAGDYATAAKELRPLAEGGNSTAQDMMGLLYSSGKGVPSDKTQAAIWYRKAAEQGNAHGLGHLSLMYSAGWGVPEDHVLGYMFDLLASKEDVSIRPSLPYEAKKLTPSQRLEAEHLAGTWKPGMPLPTTTKTGSSLQNP